MPTRKETARAFAEAVGWTFYGDRYPADADRYFTRADGRYVTNLPAADAPLDEHLAFVGRASSARWDHPPYKLHIAYEHGLGAVVWINDVRGDAPDLSWAAMLAAITAKESTS